MTNNVEKKIRVLLAEDHTLVRQGFRRMLEDEPRIAVVGEASTGLSAIEQCRQLKPDIVVMDLSMPELGGLEATAEILKELPDTKVLILSMYSNEAYVRKAFEVGAKGYILKNAIEVDLTRAIIAIAEGGAYMSPGISNLLIESLKAGTFHDQSQEPYERLTLREKEVLQLIAQGKSNKEIAALLNISVNTVAVHRAHVMETLGMHKTAELVLYAVKKGLIVPQ
ncbi:MAG TPA: response regulator transcription factor [Terriglobia bacterium]|jgi:DNA-binding NarL/FixJ family response regulator|nr:response regulator transcription factor [Terriglobia bacterium]